MAVVDAEGLFPLLSAVVFAMDGSTVFDDEGIAKPSGIPKAPDLFRGFAGAGDHGNLLLLQPAQGRSGRLPAVAVVQQRPIQVGDDPPGVGMSHRLLIQ